ncbi:LacI family DNA-binding transcriptional regulator [Bifidobacterium gallicum]|uniref:LacI family transcription regulator n=1 Tax=Bifidobacterium gallicum DSM 20093 = LMG 11596 TaxID=561180 RepID=D1NX11_9BIFI|nr:LacI family DNA-binding transcriptional regulator [Bifidobacterium gallicum]EFA22071.1 transcriptional regulator, LacI family [Bifidobacterium gallicum DSM 20093 = LMG 11596]KFI59356.1 LacI family transcription regulator [Bifidobacterium gallicum DSM 20093 = LMG 11596]
MNTSIQDVAKAAQVSISTVSRSFTRPELVSKATREKVLKVAEELNFSTSRSAAALKTGRSLRIALLMSDALHRWFSSSVIEGLNQVLHPAGYDLSIFQVSSVEDRRDFFTMLPVRRNADAVIATSFDIDTSEVSELIAIGVPVIGINSVMPRERGFTAAVNIDDVQGSILAARHLIALGHRRIAYIRSARDVSLHFSVAQRFDSFVECCSHSGITPTVITAMEGPDRIGDVVTELLSLEQLPTAIACQEDDIAIPLMFQLMRSGFSIPADFSIVGYDNSTFSSDLGLTTIAQDPQAMAATTARMTLDLIDGINPPELFVTEPAHLVVRSSTGPVPQHKA